MLNYPSPLQTNMAQSALMQQDPWVLQLTPNNTPNYEDIITPTSMERSSMWLFLLLPMILCSIMGNILVILSVMIERKLQNKINYFLQSLAVADLMVSVLVMPLGFVNDYLGYWILGQIMCNIWATLDVLNSTASIFHMCVMSIERYIAICHPLYYRKHKHSRFDNVAAKIALVWLISAVLSSFLLISGQIWPESLYADYTCRVSLKNFQLYGSLFAFFIPLAIVLLTYFLTAAKLYRVSMARNYQEDYMRTNEIDKVKFTKKVCSIRQSVSQNGEIPEECGDFQQEQVMVEMSTKTTLKRTTSSVNHSDYQEMAENGSYRMDSVAESRSKKIYRGRRNSDGCIPIYESQHRRQGSVQKHVLKRQSNSIRSQHSIRSNQSAVSSTRRFSSSSRHSTRSNQSTSSMNSANLSREKHASIVLGLVFISFVIGWTPFFLLNVVHAVCDNCVPDETVMMVFEWLGWASSLINPFIYTIFNRTYRRTFSKLLQGYFCWDQKRHAKWNSQNRCRRARVYIHYKVQYEESARV